jgi:hypothetical protein
MRITEVTKDEATVKLTKRELAYIAGALGSSRIDNIIGSLEYHKVDLSIIRELGTFGLCNITDKMYGALKDVIEKEEKPFPVKIRLDYYMASELPKDFNEYTTRDKVVLVVCAEEYFKGYRPGCLGNCAACWAKQLQNTDVEALKARRKIR